MDSSSPSRQHVYDEVRRLWVKATPEEVVRQTWIQRMVRHLGYPKELMAVEKEIRELPHLEGTGFPDRRIDLLCFAKGVAPLLLVEFKEDKLDDSAIEQVIGYNYFVKAPFIAVANLQEVCLGRFDLSLKRYVFERALPPRDVLMKKVIL